MLTKDIRRWLSYACWSIQEESKRLIEMTSNDRIHGHVITHLKQQIISQEAPNKLLEHKLVESVTQLVMQ
jgi:hypothetical protein